MLSMKEFMEMADYVISESSDYIWDCYGENAYQLDSWNGKQDGYSFTIIFDTKTQTVFEVQAHDYLHERAYRKINPYHGNAHRKESATNSDMNVAWDGVDYVDLDVDDDFVQKCLAIKAGEDYDTRVSVPVDFSDEELLQYMKLAHERDMTFNEFVEMTLREFMVAVNKGYINKKDVKKFISGKKDKPST